MARYEVIDEAVIEGTPEQIWSACEDEMTGRSSWWLPYATPKLRGGGSGYSVGAIIDVGVSSFGRMDRHQRLGVTRFAERVTELDRPRRLVTEFIEGAFRGTMETTLEPIDPEHTTITDRWRADPHGLQGLILRLFDVSAAHTTVMRARHAGIQHYLTTQRAAAGSR
jgi:hypothetical protein